MSKRLRAARKEAGLSRQALADLIGASPRLIAYYEDPEYRRGRKAIYVRPWAEACGYEFEEVWGSNHRPISRFGCFSRTAA